MRDELIEAWQTNHRINLYLIEGISVEGLRSSLSTRGGRDVARQFAHLHNTRIWHLERRAKDLAQGLEKFESKYSPNKQELVEALTASAEAISVFLGDVWEGKAKRRGFKKGVFTTLAYFVAHEGHHRGGILLTLKQCGHMPSKDVVYGIWGWDQR
ncbi:MAG: hypothetical protein IIB36_14880 [Gemmatimonadetes bacterium]|nr:hypothetical protein [Gemmatimonadota bacterium]